MGQADSPSNSNPSSPIVAETNQQQENQSEPAKSNSHHFELVEKFERCSFCNAKLLFTQDLNLNHFQVIESARCPGCGVTMKPKKFTLH